MTDNNISRSASAPRRKPRFRERNAPRAAVATPVAPAAPLPARRAAPAPQARPALPPRTAARTIALPHLTVEQALYGAVILLALGLRIWDAGSRAMHGDEAEHAWFAWNLYRGAGYAYDPVYHGPLQFPITALFYFLFGVSNTTGRLLSILCGTALVGLPYFFRREMGRPAALLASLLIALSPAMIYVSRLERDDTISALCTFILAIAVFRYVHTRQARYIYIGAGAAAFSLSAFENTYITLFILGSYVGIVLIAQYLTASERFRWLDRAVTLSGGSGRIHAPVVLGVVVLLLLAFGLTVWTGAYPPVPLVLALTIVALVARQAYLSAREEGESRYLTALRSISLQTWLNAATIIVAILFLFFSTFGTNARGIWDSTQPLLNSHQLFAYNNAHGCQAGTYFPLNPCRKDIIGGLFYWLSQHNVARGGQPWFYYPLLYGLYEQIAVVFGIGGILWFLRRPTLFTAFLTYWAVLAFGIYSWAGEKFPWLMIHPLTPFLLLAAMFVVDVVRQPGVWRWIMVAALLLLGALQIHGAYEVNYVNGADPVEMMVYVQSSPDTPKIAQDILNVSNKVTNGNDLHVTIDALDTWPFAWYLRDMPNVAYPSGSQLVQKAFSTNPVILVDESDQAALAPQLQNYTGHEYILRWWFPEDYKQLTWNSAFSDAVNPAYWSVIGQWLLERRPFGPRQEIKFYYYVRRGLASPY